MTNINLNVWHIQDQPITKISIEKLTLILIFPIKSLPEIDKGFNWIYSFKPYRYTYHKKIKIRTTYHCTDNLQND